MLYSQNALKSTMAVSVLKLPANTRDVMEGEKLNDTYRLYVKNIYRFVLFKTNSYQDAEDITSEVFLRFAKHGSSIKERSILPWLYVVAGNICISYYKTKVRTEQLTEVPEIVANQEEPWENSNAWQKVKGLFLREQQVIYLRAIEDKSFKEIAQILNKREGGVKMIYYRALKKLRGLIQEDDSNV